MMGALLFERLTLSKDKEKVLYVAKKSHEISVPKDLVKDPYVLDSVSVEVMN